MENIKKIGTTAAVFDPTEATTDNTTASTSAISDGPSLSSVHRYEVHGWKPDPTLTEDELYLDLVFLITRSTQEDGRQGHMGCVIVREKSNNNDSIVAAAVAADRLITQNIDDNENHNEDAASMEDTKRDDNNRTNKIHNDIANDAKILCLEAESLDEREFFQRIIGAGTKIGRAHV